MKVNGEAPLRRVSSNGKLVQWYNETTYLLFAGSGMLCRSTGFLLNVVDTGSLLFVWVVLYFHWVLDDMFGQWWMMRESSPKSQLAWSNDLMNATRIILVERRSPHAHMLNTFFTNHPISLLSELETDGAGGGVVGAWCFKKMVMGPAAHHVGGPGTSQVSGTDIAEFASFLLVCIELS